MVALFKHDSVPYRPLFAAPRSLSSKLLAALAVVSILFVAHSFLPSDLKPSLSSLSLHSSSRTRSTCPPDVWASGEWVPKAPPTTRTNLTKPDDVYEFLGLEGCASTREVYWHLAADNERLWDRFPGVASWRWAPPEDKCQIRDLNPAALVRDLVEQGGWLLIGDSVTENHFFSLSCLLYPHVYATPDYIEHPYYDRAWPQNLYLNPDSPLIKTLSFPPGFDIASTPLVTFRRVDLLQEPAALDALYRSLHPDSRVVKENVSLFSEEATWNLSPAEYIKLFTAPLPRANYATLIVSTAGHWTTTLFSGLRDTEMYHDGIQNVIDFFGEAMEAWARQVQALLDQAEREELLAEKASTGKLPFGQGRGRKHAPRQVVVRAYLPGHEDCHDHREPLKEYKLGRWGWYNWNQIQDFNKQVETVLESRKFPDIHYLPIDRPALLRPDAHSAGDCLHLMTGSGVLEGWSQYIWHFVTVELPGRIR
ncbi:hypothetical protein PYCCODRAFT_1377192 [Trametes coccinea BRFM310]|uniref:Uncharacterized protein n=1 Tax=Trametes coccinea (strain BRFM310) TaxID=1353009 RepID=A0A1Y2I8G7_TRAC3|nr:hypothetical protein PYCCODRAFT_1377192 [Trametes coccinea BRFM310]